MDCLIVIVVTGIYGFIKACKCEKVNQLEADGTVVMVEEDRPIGDNLMLNREPKAFMRILEELGLVKC